MSKASPQDIVIVGCGFTGTTALHQLVQDYPVRSISILEASGDFGPGYPYRTDESPEYLINNTNDTMCLEPGNRRAFFEWLATHPGYSGNMDAKGIVSRTIYGEFLRDSIARSTASAAEKGVELAFIDRECLDIDERDDERARVRWDDGEIEADMVILATGRCPDKDAFGLGEADDHWYPTHIPGDLLSGLPADAEIHVLGASLSAYDVVNRVYSPESGCRFVPAKGGRLEFEPGANDRRIILCSRSGRLKNCQSRHPQEIDRAHFSSEGIERLEDRGTTLEQVFELVRADARDYGVELDLDELRAPYADCGDDDSLQARAAAVLGDAIDAALSPQPGANFIVDYLEQAQFDTWDLFASKKLSEAEEARYRRLVESALLSYAAPCPISTAQKILALMEAGRLRILRGVRGVRRDAGGFELDHAFGTERASYLVNTTNSVDRDIRSPAQSTLIRNLVSRGTIRPYRLNGQPSQGIDVDMETFRCRGSRRIYAANMFLWGPGFFTSSAIIMATVVQRLLARAF